MIPDPHETRVSIVVPNWNGKRWLPGLLESIAAQTLAPAEVIVVDNGSSDGSREYLGAEHPAVRVLELGTNTGFAHAANVGLRAADSEFVALVNTDVVLSAEWIARIAEALRADAGAGSVACKMLSLADPATVYDAGDVLRRDGACEQRGRFGPDDGRWDQRGEVFGACAGAALYRRGAVLAVGGFDERLFAYLEDVDLALRLRLAGWRCRYEPVVALHAGEGSSEALRRGPEHYVARNSLLLIVKAFPARWAPLVLYRQLGWAAHAAADRRLWRHLRALGAALPLLPSMVSARRALRSAAVVSIEEAIPVRPWRGPAAGGHSPGSGRADSISLRRMPVITGERVSGSDGGFNPSFQRHRAEYRLCAELLGPGRVLDLGCGTGHSRAELAPRESVGVDLEAAALAGQDRETHVADMRKLPFADASFSSVVSIQSIEHVPDPDLVLAEVVRVLVPRGRAIFVTPNRLTFGRPDEIIDPYHYVEYDAEQLRTLCARQFESVQVQALHASPRYLAIHDDERRELERLLARDPLRLRRFVPRRGRQRLYDWRLRGDRVTPRPGALEITPEDFWLSDDELETAIDLVAVCDRD